MYFRGSESKIHYNDIERARSQNLGMSELGMEERDVVERPTGPKPLLRRRSADNIMIP